MVGVCLGRIIRQAGARQKAEESCCEDIGSPAHWGWGGGVGLLTPELVFCPDTCLLHRLPSGFLDAFPQELVENPAKWLTLFQSDHMLGVGEVFLSFCISRMYSQVLPSSTDCWMSQLWPPSVKWCRETFFVGEGEFFAALFPRKQLYKHAQPLPPVFPCGAHSSKSWELGLYSETRLAFTFRCCQGNA